MSEPPSMTLGALRRRLGVKQAEVAAKTGYTQQWISDIEKAPIESLTIRTLDAYLAGLGCRLRLVAQFEDGPDVELR